MLFIVIVIVAIFGIGFWIWMLVDCLRIKNLKNKLLWLIVLILFNFYGAGLYYLMVKRKRQNRVSF